MTILDTNATHVLIGKPNGGTWTAPLSMHVTLLALPDLAQPVMVTAKAVTVQDGGRVRETVILHQEYSFEAWIGFCKTRGAWFKFANQEELVYV